MELVTWSALAPKAAPMQWVFLVLAVLAALSELHTGTFYLAGVSVAALFTTVIGFWLRGDWLIFVFVVLCAALMIAVLLLRRHHGRSRSLADFDIGQIVTVRDVSPQRDRLTVNYRGTNWEATMEDGSVLAPGDVAIIARKTDKLLHLVIPPKAART
jgi:membrane protein implicated in regulation of membrane protease activity